MALKAESYGCLLVRQQRYCPNNITLLFYDGQPIPASNCTLNTCSLLVSNWGYIPNKPGNVFFIILFLMIFLAQLPLGIWKKTWGVLIGMSLGAALEVLGYVGRVLAVSQPFAFNPFLIYIIFLTIAPAFLSAAIYMCLSHIITAYGTNNARFDIRTYYVVFMFSDFVALVLQGAGGGIASINASKDAIKAQRGINIMIAGLAWQVVSLTLFVAASVDFAWCIRQKRGILNPTYAVLRESKKFKGFLWSLGIQTLVIYIRSCYRVAELSQGFTGTIPNEEAPYMIFESTMIAIACICMTILHPSYVFGDLWRASDLGDMSKMQDAEKEEVSYQDPLALRGIRYESTSRESETY